VDAQPGSVPISGVAANLRTVRRLDAQPGNVPIAGTNAQLKASRRLDAQSGNVAITGTAVSLQVMRRLLAASGTVPITGTNADLVLIGAGATSGPPIYVPIARAETPERGPGIPQRVDAHTFLGRSRKKWVRK
jgi:hypothetical protein